jgi:Flp pilus assembly pilin Flp
MARGKGCPGMLKRLWRDQGGASLFDYATLVAAICAIVVTGVAVAGAWGRATWVRLNLLPLLGQLTP